MATYLLIRIPRPPATPAVAQAKGALWREMLFGWQYLWARPGLLGLVLMGAFLNLFGNVANTLLVPMVLSFTDAAAVGAVLAVSAGGVLVAGGLLSIWGSPARLVRGMLALILLGGVGYILAGWVPMVMCIAAGHFLSGLALHSAGGLMTAIEQRKVAPDVQGRVFGAEGMLALLFEAAAYPSAGLLADRIFEPLMMGGSPLASMLGPAIGYGQGRGMGLQTMVMGLCLLIVAGVGYLYPRVRHLEDELPETLAS